MSPDRFSVDVLLTHESLVRGLARSILHGDDRVEDVVQDTLATALMRAPRDPGALARWLGTISRRLALKVRRGDEARRRREGAPRSRNAVPTPAEITEREETRRAVLTALLDLDPIYRDALLLRYYEDLPPREIAANLDLPVETVRTRIKRGIVALRKTLRARYGDGKRALPLALVFLAESPVKAAPGALVTLKAVAVATVLAGAAAVGVVVLDSGAPVAPPSPPPTPPPPAVAAVTPPTAHIPDAPLAKEPTAEPKHRSYEFQGMSLIPQGPFEMGIDAKTLIEMYGDPAKPNHNSHPLLAGRDKALWWNLIALETPHHVAVTEAYAIDRHVVTNAQYHRFLDNEAKGSFVTTQKVDTIAEVAREIYGGETEELDEWQKEVIFWHNERKLLELWDEVRRHNAAGIRTVLDEFNEFRPKPARIANFLKLPDRQRARAWIDFVLPGSIVLLVYRRGVPDHWPKGVPADEQLTLPVVYVSADDAAAFAAWAGKHIPTEEEWEKAARGPKGFLYPWGNTWDPVAEKNRIVWLRADSPPAAKFKDHAVDARRLVRGASPYGVFNMLGNVREWTSSVPRLYPGSTAKDEPWFGKKAFRVLRSTSYGDGMPTARGPELIHRNTARAMHGPADGIGRGQRFAAVGFRCAKYHEPAREVLAARIQRLREDGVLPTRLDLAPRHTLGTEKLDYAPTGEEGPNGVIVRGRAKAIGFVPAREILVRPQPVETLLLGFLYWNADVSLVLGKEKRLPAHAFGYVVALREGRPVLLTSPFRADSAAHTLPVSGEDPILHPGEPSDPPPGLTRTGGEMLFRIDFGKGQDGRRLSLPLTFEGSDRPDTTWR